MRKLYSLFIFCICLSLFSCQEIIDNAVNETAIENRRNDSLNLINEEESPLESVSFLSEKYKILRRSKVGNDSIVTIRTFYLSGEKYGEQTYRNGKQDSISTFYHKNGSIFCRMQSVNNRYENILELKNKKGKDLNPGTFKNGSGYLIIYNPLTEKPEIEANFKDRKKEGNVKYYYESGQLKADATYKNDSLNGKLTVYFQNGKTREVENYVNGTKDGKQLSFYSNGKFKLMEVWKDQMPESVSEFDRDGRLTSQSTKNVTKNTAYHSNGNLQSTSTLINGLKEGKFLYYHENKKIRREEIWLKDELQSDKEWFENGQLQSESVYKDNQKTGIYKEYYANGNPRQVAEYANDKQNGKTTSYYGNGKLYFTGTYVDDKPFGKFDYYTETGAFKGSNVFK